MGAPHITRETVKEIKRLRKLGWTLHTIAKKVRVSMGSVFAYTGARKPQKLVDICFWCGKNRCPSDHKDEMERDRWRNHLKAFDTLVKDGHLGNGITEQPSKKYATLTQWNNWLHYYKHTKEYQDLTSRQKDKLELKACIKCGKLISLYTTWKACTKSCGRKPVKGRTLTLIKESWYFTNMRANMRREGKSEEEIERAINRLKARWTARNVITDHWGV